MFKKLVFGSTFLSAMLLLGACGDDTPEATSTENEAPVEQVDTEQQSEAKQMPAGFMTQEDFEANYNNFIQAENIPLSPLAKGTVETGAVQDTIMYMPQNTIALNATVNKEDGLINGVTFIGAPDESEQSGLEVIMGMGTVAAAMDPSLTADQRGQIFEGLGLLSEGVDLTDHEAEYSINGFTYHLVANDLMGLMMSVYK